MEFKADGDMSLYKYWKKHRISIAKDRHWAIQEGDQYSFETCTTLRQYDDYIKKVAGYLDMSISEITLANILLAVSKVAKECKYQEATVKTIISHCGMSFPMPPHADMLITSFQKIVQETSRIILRL